MKLSAFFEIFGCIDLERLQTHALHDMADPGAKSWLNRIRAKGLERRPILAGMLETDAICQI